MKKVGIVTFHNAHNYGAVLQCYALKEALKKMGYDTEVINHKNEIIENIYALWPRFDEKRSLPKKIRSFVYRSLINIRKRSRFRAFQRFIADYLDVDINSTVDWSKYDAIIWGSDQIWNSNIIGDDPVFWGKISTTHPVKLTYAASMGKIDKATLESNFTLLKSYNNIGVREVDLQTALRQLGIESCLNLDPTMLLDGKEWEKLIPAKQKQKGDYLLVYAVRNPSETLEAARKIGKRLKLKVVELTAGISMDSVKKKHYTASPIDFISLIRNASFVVTDSFHGTVFSIIFGVPFFSLKHSVGGNERALHLTSVLGLSERMISIQEIPTEFRPINFDSAHSKLISLRNESIEYLRNSIDIQTSNTL